MINTALQLTVVVLATISGLECKDESALQSNETVNVQLTSNKNFSLPCKEFWSPTCAQCKERDITFLNYCTYYNYMARDDGSCKFHHFGLCPKTDCQRKKCTEEKNSLCATCGNETLSFQSMCEFDNFNCFNRNACIRPVEGRCQNRKGETIHQSFHEKSLIYKTLHPEL